VDGGVKVVSNRRIENQGKKSMLFCEDYSLSFKIRKLKPFIHNGIAVQAESPNAVRDRPGANSTPARKGLSLLVTLRRFRKPFGCPFDRNDPKQRAIPSPERKGARNYPRPLENTENRLTLIP
jgi:hypothetical protein